MLVGLSFHDTNTKKSPLIPVPVLNRSQCTDQLGPRREFGSVRPGTGAPVSRPNVYPSTSEIVQEGSSTVLVLTSGVEMVTQVICSVRAGTFRRPHTTREEVHT